tara:strand:- start:429 stop:611 length:183 start_codon:yes stop_codon:yes gene_type:complete
MLREGMTFSGIYFTGTIQVDKIDEEKNILHVTLTTEGSPWTEEWNLAHTRAGIKNGDYVI